MILDNVQEELRKIFMDSLQLTKKNEELAQEYLDMDREEAPELLDRAERQDFSAVKFQNTVREQYLGWLYKKKRKEELGRFVRFLVKIGGVTAWKYFSGKYYMHLNRTAELDKMLVFLTGEEAREQKIALKAELLGFWINEAMPEDVKALCEAGEEEPEIFLRAMKYCRSIYVGAEDKRDNARMLLTAMYLHWTPPLAAPELTAYLEENLTAAIEDIMPFEFHELAQLQTYAQNARRDTPFPQSIMNIFSQRNQRGSTVFFTACAFLAVRHSMRFEILLRLAAATEYRFADRKFVLDTCRGIVEEDWFQARMAEMEDMLPIEDEDYILWALKTDCQAVAERMTAKCPEGVKRAAEKAESELYEKLMKIVRDINPALYGEMKDSYWDTLRRKIADEALLHNYYGKNEVSKRYLLQEASAEELAPYAAEWVYLGYVSLIDEEKYKKIDSLRKKGEFSMYRRAAALALMHKEIDFFKRYKVYATQESSERTTEDSSGGFDGRTGSLLEDKGQLRSIFDLMQVEELPFWMRADALGGICESIKDKKKKALQTRLTAEVFVEWLREQKEERREESCWEESLKEAVSKTVPSCTFTLRVLEKMGAGRYRDIILSCAGNSVKPVRELLLEICGKHEEWEGEILALLSSKKQKEREFAVLVLGEWCRPSCLEAVRAAGETEKNKKLAAMLEELTVDLESAADLGGAVDSERASDLGGAADSERASDLGGAADSERASDLAGAAGLERAADLGGAADSEGAADFERTAGSEKAADSESTQTGRGSALLGRAEEKLAAKILRGARKKKVEWAQGMTLPEVHRADGALVSEEYLLAILALYADMDVPGIPEDAVRLTRPLAQKELWGYLHALYEGWMSMGAEAKKRWVLYAVSIHGGPAMVSVLYQQIKEWAEHSRGAIAAEAVRALALNGSPEALILVDQMSRKFKFRQIKNAAGEALSNAASALGISREALEDRIVPNLGLDPQGERVFDYGVRRFTVRLSPALEIEIYDGNGKLLKNMPSPGKQDDPEKAGQASEEFKQMKKQLKTVVQNQKLRLEQALSTARFWKAQDWKKLFVENPMMHRFAAGLIWGVYEGGVLKEAFRYMEDGSFNTADEEEYVFPEGGFLKDASAEQPLENGGAEESGIQEEPGVPEESIRQERMIGLVHPLELSKEELSAWKTQLEDYETAQPFEQLNRPVYGMTEEEKEEGVLGRFHDTLINGLSLSGRLLGMGWSRGEIMDAGFFESYYRKDGVMGAELTFSGSSVGCENDEVTVYDLYFYRQSDRMPETGACALFSKENRCRIKDVNPRYFSEVVLQIAKAVEGRGK